jgi:hypothetical protein
MGYGTLFWVVVVNTQSHIFNYSRNLKSFVQRKEKNHMVTSRLLFYKDFNQNGTGDVNTPKVIGQSGWGDYKFVFSGGNGIIYAVDQAGRLLFFRDKTQDGTGDIGFPKVIGLGGWQQFKFLFWGGNGIIYAVDQAGRLLFYRDYHQDGTGDVDTPMFLC